MPKRIHPRQRQQLYKRLSDRDGESCANTACGLTPSELGELLTIDHVDEDKDNWKLSNLVLLCRPCNVAKSNRLRPRRAKKECAECDVSGDRVCVCDPSAFPDTVRLRKAAIDYENGSAEMQANGLFEGSFREWLVNYVAAHGAILWSDAVNTGAELTGGSPETMRRYGDKLTSLIGPLEKAKDQAGRTIIIKRTWYGD